MFNSALNDAISIFKHEYEECIVITVNKALMNLTKNMVCIFPYVAPEYSPVFEESTLSGIEILENLITDIVDALGDVHVLIGGDLNARCGILDDTVMDNTLWKYIKDYEDAEEFFPTMKTTRESQDPSIVNKYGKQLVQLCKVNNFCILNGRCKGDEDGKITCIANKGKSIVDYFIVDINLFEYIKSMCIIPRPESDHFPLFLEFNVALPINVEIENDCKLSPFEKLKWVKDMKPIYDDLLKNKLTQNEGQFRAKLQESAEDALNILYTCCKDAAEPMQKGKKNTNNSRKKQPEWWDQECSEAKKEKYFLLEQFHKSSNSVDLVNYLGARKHFRKLCSQKKKELEDKKVKTLSEACRSSDCTSFWKALKNMLVLKNHSDPVSISNRTWFDYFKSLLNPISTCETDEFDKTVHTYLDGLLECRTAHSYNDVISMQEIISAIKCLKSGKAAGPDSLSAEFIMNPSGALLDYIHLIFNNIFDTSRYPGQFRESIIFPLFKKGNTNDVNNYRGISLLNVLSKVFARIINNRLKDWAEDMNIIPLSQAGFRAGFSTIDHIFTLQSLVQKFITKKCGRFYVLFVDFSKAFDTVQRHKLLYVLSNYGLQGKLFNIIKSMYCDVRCSVRIRSNITEYFSCHTGVRQGCILSPLLFIIFISQLDNFLNNCKDVKGVELLTNDANANILLYADDLCLLSESVIDLQRKINYLSAFCKKWGLKINMDKTRAIVYRRGGILRNSEKFFYNGERIKTATYYNYLGLLFSSRLVWSKCMDTLASRSQVIIAKVRQICKRYRNIDTRTLFIIFDSKIKPMLLYGSEIWGTKFCAEIEAVHVKFCKTVLNVGKTTYNDVAIGDCGRFHLFVDYQLRAIKFWCKILSMKNEKFAKKSYLQLKLHDESGRNNWASQMRILLCNLGFGVAWLSQGVGNVDIFISTVKRRLQDQSIQLWHADVQEVFPEYLNYHPALVAAPYITHLASHKRRRLFCLLRSQSLPLGNNLVRLKLAESNICSRCRPRATVIDDEFHFLFQCEALSNLRKQFLPSTFLVNPSVTKMYLLMSSYDPLIVSNVVSFIEQALSDH